MSDSPAAKAATAVLYGTGGLGLVGAFLWSQGMWAKHVIGHSDARPPSPDGLYGADLGGRTLSMLVIGDSSIVGYGMTRADDTPPAMLGEGLAHVLDRPVRITSRAVVGAKTADLQGQIDEGLSCEPDVTVIVVGANDVTHLRRPHSTAAALGEVVRRLRAAGSEVVVSTCPDLGSIRPLPEPLRSLAKVWSRALAEQQTISAVWAGARTIASADLLGELFREQPEVMFGEDRFHPSRTGYANLVSVILTAVVATVRESEAVEYSEALEHLDGAPHARMPVSQAAHEAVHTAGAQVTKSGRWASLLKRHRAELSPSEFTPGS